MGLLCMDEYLDERISPVKLIYWPDETTQIPAHWHTNMELNFIASGAMTLLENGRELRMEAGAVHFMNSGVVHRMEVGDSLGLTLVFSNKFIRELCPGTTAPPLRLERLSPAAGSSAGSRSAYVPSEPGAVSQRPKDRG